MAITISDPIPKFRNPRAIGSGFGRFFYGVDNTVYFSQVLDTVKDAGKCYQNNDPTSDELSDLLDTDGGIIPIKGAINIRAFTEFRLGILVFCDNGVWYIYGGDGGFTATSYRISKVTERGITAIKSIVSAEGTVMYFSDNGIMQVVANEFDNLDAVDITEQTIKARYISDFATQGNINATYNSVDKEIWWINRNNGKMMVLDVVVGAFYPQESASPSRDLSNAFKVGSEFYYANYLSNATDRVAYNFAKLTDRTFKDFGVDQTAYLVSGYETLGKFSNKKSVAEAMFFFEKTETQITGYDTSTNTYNFDWPSSCLFQSRWDFDNSNVYAKWVGRTTTESGRGKKVELYKPMQRGFIPDSYPYTFDTGEGVITKKVNIRGKGKAVQFRFEAQPEKDMRMLGYNVKYTMKGSMG